jgi:hypothetical protein
VSGVDSAERFRVLQASDFYYWFEGRLLVKPVEICQDVARLLPIGKRRKMLVL